MTSELTYQDQLALDQMMTLAHHADAVCQQFTFQDYQSQKAANTLKAQQRDFDLFKRLLKLDPVIDLYSKPVYWQAMTAGLITFFKVLAQKEGYAVSTINRVIATLRVYARLAYQADVINTDTYTKIRAVRGIQHHAAINLDAKREQTRKSNEKLEANFLTPQECKQLKSPTPKNNFWMPIDYRDRLMMCLLVDFGLRASEVAGIKLKDVDRHHATLYVYRKKTKKHQVLSFHADFFPDLHDAMTDWLDADFNLTYVMDRGHALLRSSRVDGYVMDKPMTRITVSRRVRVLGKRLLNIRNLSAHDLRNSFARNAIDNGADIAKVMQSGGWESPEMVLRYVGQYEIANDGMEQIE